MTTLTLFLLLLGFMLIGVPIAIALGLSSALTMLLFTDDSVASLAEKVFGAMHHSTLMAIPFFVLASAFLTTGGVARRMIEFAVDLVGWLRGGLGMGSVVACMLFAAVSGSSPATVAAIGPIVIAGMVRQGYPKDFAAGLICNSGTLGMLIPPSIVMVVYAAVTEVSVGRMFMAGVLPGIVMSGLLMIAILIAARRMNLPAQPFPGWGALLRSAAAASGGLWLIVIIMGGIYGGIFTPTEAAAVSAIYAMLVAVLAYRDLGPLKGQPWRKARESLLRALGRNLGLSALALLKLPLDGDMRRVLIDAARVTIMLMFIIANAMLFAHVLTAERIPHAIADTINGMGLEPWMFLIIVNLVLLAAGNFMEPSAILMIMAPILFPTAMALGIDPIHLGIIMIVNMEIGMITPPVGLNLFVTSAVAGMPLGQVVRAALPWLGILLLFLIVITYIPWVSTALPNAMFGPETVIR